jgi:NAD(P)-dependent dehydrogenase (short-subunit alcohol dehydrogenase family)
MSVYSATKAAVRSLARGWALDLKDKRIRINVLSPGMIPTPGFKASGMSDEQIDGLMTNMLPSIPQGRPGTPDEIAKAVVFLVSDDSSYVNAAELYVDGGLAQI